MVTFYATIDADGLARTLTEQIPSGAYLVSAASWWRKYGKLRMTPLPPQCSPIGGDWGGFHFTRKLGLTMPPFSLAELAEWYAAMGVTWGAATDYCVAQDTGSDVVRDCQDRTTAAAWEAWQSQRAAPLAWVPTVQGAGVEDYRRHARQLRLLVTEMAAHYGPDGGFRVGVGSLVGRDARTVRAIAVVVAAELPGIPLHLWGVKQQASRGGLPLEVASLDTAAWNRQTGPKDRARHDAWRGVEPRRAWAYREALPQYRAEVEAAIGEAFQYPLIDIPYS